MPQIIPIIGALAPLLAAGGAAAGGVGKSGFTADDNSTDPNAYKFGGTTPEEAEASRLEAQAAAAEAAEKARLSSGKATSGFDPKVAELRAAANAARAKADAAGSYAQQDRQRSRGMAYNDRNRKGVQMDLGAYNADRDLALKSRGEMADVASSFRDAAAGKGPTAASAILQKGQEQAQRGNLALAQSYRGGALGRGEATSKAIATNANMQNETALDAAALRAKEQQAAMQGWGSAAGAVASRDMGAAGMSLGQSTTQAGLNDDQAARNDQSVQYWEDKATGVDNTQLNASMRHEEADQQGAMAADKVNSGVAGGNAAADANIFNGMVGAGSAASGEFGKWWDRKEKEDAAAAAKAGAAQKKKDWET